MTSKPASPIATGRRVALYVPAPTDEEDFLAFARASRRHHHPWISAPSTPQLYAVYLERIARDTHTGFLARTRADGTIAGVINVNEIVRGALQSGYLGYYGSPDTAGTGCMTEGMRLCIGYCFRTLRLHRLEANIQPGNHASIALARRCGLKREGFSPRYLKIGGRWRDHERWAIVRP